jgi:signal transduction histidine kinase
MRLEVRVTLWLAVLLGAATALTLMFMARFETQNLERQWTQAGEVLAVATESSLEVSMLHNAPDDIRQTVRNVEEGDLIDSVTVYRRNGSIWVTSNGQSAPFGQRRDALLTAMDRIDVLTSASDEKVSVFVPVEKQPECVGCHASDGPVLGAVEVRMDEGPFRTQITESARSSLFLAGIPLLLGLIASVWAVRRTLLKPLAQIGDAAARLGEGDLSVRVPEQQESWELAEVATTFNDMAAQLELQAADLTGSVERLRAELEGMEEIEALLTSGAGLPELLARVAVHIGGAMDADGVGIWKGTTETASATWGTLLPDAEAVRLAHEEEVALCSAGALDDAPEDVPLGWVIVPARRNDRTLALVGVAWDPPRPLDAPRRDLLATLVGLVAIAVENADLLERLRTKEESLQGLVRKTLTAQEEERRRISRELHDETSQVLSALMMNIDLLETQVPSSEASAARIEAVKALAEEAARNLDKMLLDLRPALLDELGLMPALRWYVAQVSDLYSLDIGFVGGKIGRLPEHIEVAAFRIVQEAVGNAARHANATHVKVVVAAEGESLRVQVADDGVGFDVAEVSARAGTGESVGLMGMRERAELAGGTLEVVSQPGRGTTVTAELPLTVRMEASLT